MIGAAAEHPKGAVALEHVWVLVPAAGGLASVVGVLMEREVVVARRIAGLVVTAAVAVAQAASFESGLD